jgi:hypothetical protein
MAVSMTPVQAPLSGSYKPGRERRRRRRNRHLGIAVDRAMLELALGVGRPAAPRAAR